jgi:1-aminocyclopropane-1-carboxylate deaminase/D-cysteine desulfhydrase-like pyridoxal-dependent ACC family enzyme
MQGYSLKNVVVNKLFTQNDITLSALRLDAIHPVVSGNKLFKLQYFLEDALQSPHKTILTFGGAYSNHLLATAFACRQAGLKSIGIVRGEESKELSHTLQNCIEFGMQLKFISREKYSIKDDDNFIAALKNDLGECIVIPEGGYHPSGAKGAGLIMDLIKQENYSHICTASGTATTLAGLLQNANKNQQIISVPVLKGMDDTIERLKFLTQNNFEQNQLTLFTEYHFGGYAKKTAALISFMNDLWQQYSLPTDFVYTAKLFYAVLDKIKLGYFKAGSNILCLHTGGLQGNLSLPAGTLNF